MIQFSSKWILALLLPIVAQGKTFTNSYISFEIPESWNCQLDASSWICNPSSIKEAKEAIIVINAKRVGPEDNSENFKSFLAKPRTITNPNGTPITSKVYSVEERMIGNQKWIRSQHFASEVPNFYTLYMVTTREQLAVLLSFSVERNKALNYNSVFDHAIRSIKMVASQELLNPKMITASSDSSKNSMIGIELDKTSESVQAPTPLPHTGLAAALLGLVLLSLAFFYFKKSR